MTTDERDSRVLPPKSEATDPFGTHHEAGRPLEVLVGVAAGVVGLPLALGSAVAIGALLIAALFGNVSSWPLLIVAAVFAPLGVFLCKVSWRLIANKPRPGGELLPPWLVIWFGICMELTSVLSDLASSNFWLFITGIVGGAVAVAAGVKQMWSRRAASARQGGG